MHHALDQKSRTWHEQGAHARLSLPDETFRQQLYNIASPLGQRGWLHTILQVMQGAGVIARGADTRPLRVLVLLAVLVAIQCCHAQGHCLALHLLPLHHLELPLPDIQVHLKGRQSRHTLRSFTVTPNFLTPTTFCAAHTPHLHPKGASL